MQILDENVDLPLEDVVIDPFRCRQFAAANGCQLLADLLPVCQGGGLGLATDVGQARRDSLALTGFEQLFLAPRPVRLIESARLRIRFGCRKCRCAEQGWRCKGAEKQQRAPC